MTAPTPQQIVFAQSSLTHLRTKLRDVDRLDEPARWALDALEVVVGAQARTLADEPLPVPEPYKPKVGERARLVSSPDYKPGAWPLGREFTFESQKQVEDVTWTELRDHDGSGRIFCVRGAVLEPVAAQEPTAEPAQPEANDPIASARRGLDLINGVSHVPGDGCTEAQSREERHRGAYLIRAALDTLELDRAAQAAEVERLQDEREQFRETVTAVKEVVERFPVHHRIGTMPLHACVSSLLGAYEALVRERENTRVELDRREVTIGTLETKLAAARAERPEPTDEELATALFEAVKVRRRDLRELPPMTREVWLSLARAAKAALLGVRREGAMPTREQIATATEAAENKWADDENDTRPQRMVRADAVLALFGAEPKGRQDSGPAADDGKTFPGTSPEMHSPSDAMRATNPGRGNGSNGNQQAGGGAEQNVTAAGPSARKPVPSSAVGSGADERPWNYEAPPESETGRLHELLPYDPENEVYEFHTMFYSGLETRVDGKPRWNDKASGAYRVMGMSVAAWRRAEPKGQPEAAVGEPKLTLDHRHVIQHMCERLSALERAVEGLKGGAP